MAIPLNQGSLGALVARAEQAQRSGSLDEAIQCLELAVRICPDHHQLLANLGNALWLADRPALALAPYRQAVLLAPGDPVVYRGLANVLVDLGRFNEADRAYRRSSALADAAATTWNHSQLLIGLERYAEGYALAESRWALAGVQAFRGAGRRCTSVEQLDHGPLRVWSEQGLGDTLQHLRWLGPLLQRRRQARDPVVLEVEPCLVRLLEQALPPVAGALVVCAKDPDGAEASDAVHVSLLSLPHLLGGAPLPAPTAWLQADHWPAATPSATPRCRGVQLRPGARIGVVWAAGRKLEDPFQRREYVKRSLPAGALGRLVSGLRAMGMLPVNLQFGPDRGLGTSLEPGFCESLAEGADFAATAELVADLDLVITVDTAMAHLVGAMARPGVLLLPWAAAPRWLRGRHDSPWYPSLRLFRQPQPGDWRAVVDAVLGALAQPSH